MKKLWKFLGFALLIILIMLMFWPAAKKFTVSTTKAVGLTGISDYEAEG